MQNLYNQSLENLNTFRVKGTVSRLIDIENIEEIDYLFEEEIFKNNFLIIGEGSNLLFTHDFNGTIVRLQTKGIEKVNESDDFIWLKVAAGEKWEEFVQYCISNSYFGIENLIGIPGNVGSAPVQNVGAYGVEVKDVIEEVNGIYIDSKEKFILSNHECQFDYRDSIFKNQLKNKTIITSVVFKLSKNEFYTLTYNALRDSLQQKSLHITQELVALTVLEIRNKKLPDITKIGSAGSFFKNPIIEESRAGELLKKFPNLSLINLGNRRIKLAAAQLIDMCGCKTWQTGDVKLYPHQPLVIVNEGNATGAQIVEFAHKIQQIVYSKFEIELFPEVNIIFP